MTKRDERLIEIWSDFREAMDSAARRAMAEKKRIEFEWQEAIRIAHADFHEQCDNINFDVEK